MRDRTISGAVAAPARRSSELRLPGGLERHSDRHNDRSAGVPAAGVWFANLGFTRERGGQSRSVVKEITLRRLRGADEAPHKQKNEVLRQRPAPSCFFKPRAKFRGG